MKTEFKTNVKDNVATGLLLAAMFTFAVASIGSSVAKTTMHNSSQTDASQPAVQKMETIVVTAQRIALYKMETIVVTAPHIGRQLASAKAAATAI